MKKYIELQIRAGRKTICDFVDELTSYASDAFRFYVVREDELTHSGSFIEFRAKRRIDYLARVILFWGENGLRVSNIIPKTISFLEMEQYNSVLRHFYEDVIQHTIPEQYVVITKEENSMQDLISASAYRALVKWEDLCNKNSPTTHPNDRERWMDFICELYINDDHLSLSDFRNWLIEDKGWYYDPNDDSDKVLLNLELDLEFGLDLIAHYAKKTEIE